MNAGDFNVPIDGGRRYIHFGTPFVSHKSPQLQRCCAVSVRNILCTCVNTINCSRDAFPDYPNTINTIDDLHIMIGKLSNTKAPVLVARASDCALHLWWGVNRDRDGSGSAWRRRCFADNHNTTHAYNIRAITWCASIRA